MEFYRETEFQKTEMGEIPIDWEVKTIFDISIDLISGGTPSTKKENYWSGNIPWMTSEHINGRFITNGQRNITTEGLNNSASNLVPKDNLLVATRVGIGKAALNKIDIAVSQDLTGVIVNKEKATPDYLFWFLMNNEIVLKSIAQGSTIKGILREDLGKLKIALPQIKEQRQIASILSRVDDAIQKTDEIIQKTQLLKKGLMQELLTKGIGHKEFKYSEELGCEIPKEWEVKKIGDIGKVITGTTPRTKVDKYWNGNYPFVTPTDISDAKYVVRTERTVSEEGAKMGRFVPRNSVLVTCIASIGKSALAFKECITNQQINAIICNKKIDPHYTYYILKYRNNALKNTAGKTTNAIIKKSLFEQFKIPIPNRIEEQRRIASILSKVDDQIEKERQTKEQLEKLKKGLMQLLLTGKVRVKVN